MQLQVISCVVTAGQSVVGPGPLSATIQQTNTDKEQAREQNKPGNGGAGYLQGGEHQGRVAVGQGELRGAGGLSSAGAPHLGQLGGQRDERPVARLQQVRQLGGPAAQVLLLSTQRTRLGGEFGHLVLQGLDLGLHDTNRREQEQQTGTTGAELRYCLVLGLYSKGWRKLLGQLYHDSGALKRYWLGRLWLNLNHVRDHIS